MKNNISLISTTQDMPWADICPDFDQISEDTLELTGEKFQKIDGFGGCFNELGWTALTIIEEKERDELLSELFDKKEGLKFNFCRLPIGASDYALEWYSCNETDNDYKMEHFSIDRDKKYLIPYINSALKINEDIKLFASPWSPPIWMKYPKVYNFGKLIWKKENLEAYALYFEKFVNQYKEEGIKINQVHVQNEVIADQKFPSCVWSGDELKEFIGEYLGPQFENNDIDTEIWLGTINAPEDNNKKYVTDYDNLANYVLSFPKARKYIKGVGYQWAGKNAIQQTYESWPEIQLMQSENECGDGKNTWEYARYVFNLFKHYLSNGVNSYIYWNMVLEPEGRSTWGWTQNSLITIDPITKEIIRNPEYYVMKHFSHFIERGAVRLGTKGHWNGNALAFENPNGEIIIVVSNGMNIERKFSFIGKGEPFTVTLKPYSFNTLKIED